MLCAPVQAVAHSPAHSGDQSTPHSTGCIALRSADPQAKPVIDPRYLSDSGGRDRAAMMEGLRICAKISKAPALRGVLARSRARSHGTLSRAAA